MKELETRSTNKSPLDDLFETPDKDVDTFMDTLQDVLKDGNPRLEKGFVRKLVSGEVDRVKAPKPLKPCLSGFVRIFHGWHRNDYVWHIEHAAIRRPWKTPIDRVIYTIAKIMHANLPDVEAKIWPPLPDWELKTVTFKALDLNSYWNFSESDIQKINEALLDSLNKLV